MITKCFYYQMHQVGEFRSPKRRWDCMQ